MYGNARNGRDANREPVELVGVEYDNLGRITDLSAKYSGGGKLETSYYVNDLTRSQTQDGITNTYNLDAGLGRFLTRDPVLGGSSNAYEYAFQDPVNQVDLDGRHPVIRAIGWGGKEGFWEDFQVGKEGPPGVSVGREAPELT